MCWLCVCVCVWWLQLLKLLNGHTGSVYAVAWSRDAGTIASGGRDNTVRLWSAATGQASAFCASHRSQFCEFACRVCCVGIVVSVCCCACCAIVVSGLVVALDFGLAASMQRCAFVGESCLYNCFACLLLCLLLHAHWRM